MSSTNNAVRSLVFLHHLISAVISAVVIVGAFILLSLLNGQLPAWWLSLSFAGAVAICSIPIVRAFSDKRADNDYVGWIGICVLCIAFWGAGEIHDFTIEKTIEGAKGTLDSISKTNTPNFEITTPKVEVTTDQVQSSQNSRVANQDQGSATAKVIEGTKPEKEWYNFEKEIPELTKLAPAGKHYWKPTSGDSKHRFGDGAKRTGTSFLVWRSNAEGTDVSAVQTITISN